MIKKLLAILGLATVCQAANPIKSYVPLDTTTVQTPGLNVQQAIIGGNLYPTTIATTGNCIGATTTGVIGYVQCGSSGTVTGSANIPVYNGTVLVSSPTSGLRSDGTSIITTLVGGATAQFSTGPNVPLLNSANGFTNNNTFLDGLFVSAGSTLTFSNQSNAANGAVIQNTGGNGSSNVLTETAVNGILINGATFYQQNSGGGALSISSITVNNSLDALFGLESGGSIYLPTSNNPYLVIGVETNSGGIIAPSLTANTSDFYIIPKGSGKLKVRSDVNLSGTDGELDLYTHNTVMRNYIGLKAPSSLSSSPVWTWPGSDGTGGQVLSTDGSGNLSWETGSGGGGGTPGGLSPQLQFNSNGVFGGVSGSVVTGTSITYSGSLQTEGLAIAGTSPGTIYATGSGSNSFQYSGSSMTVNGTAVVFVTTTTDQRIDAIEAPGFYVNVTTDISNDSGAQTDVIYAKLHNTSASTSAAADGIAVHGRAVDSQGSNGQLLGMMGEVFGQGLAPAYTGLWGTAGWASDLPGGTTSEIEGLRLIAQITNLAGNVPLSTGTLKLLYIPDFTNGHGAANQSWPIYVAAPYPSFFNGFIGIGQKLPVAPLQVNVSTNTQYGIIVASVPVGNTTDITSSNYTATITNTGIVSDRGETITGPSIVTTTQNPGGTPDSFNINYTQALSGSERMTGLRSTTVNTSTNSGSLSVAVGVQAVSTDTGTVGANGTLEGVDARVTGTGYGAQYAGEVVHGNWDSVQVGGTTSTIVGLQITNSITSGDGATATSTGTLKQLYITDPVGSGASGQSWAIYDISRFPSYFNNFIGIGDNAPSAVLSVAASTNTTYAIAAGSVPFYTGVFPASNYTFTVTNQGQAQATSLLTNTPSSTGKEISVSTTTTYFHVAVSTSGHFLTGGPAPTISSCGTTPNGSVVGDDNQGTISVGGGVVTACTLNFANTFGTTPVCTVSDNSATVADGITSQSPTSITLGFSATLGGGTVNYRCGCSGSSCR